MAVRKGAIERTSQLDRFGFELESGSGDEGSFEACSFELAFEFIFYAESLTRRDEGLSSQYYRFILGCRPVAHFLAAAIS